MADSTVTIKLNVDLRPALESIDAFIAALTEMRDRLEVEIEQLLGVSENSPNTETKP